MEKNSTPQNNSVLSTPNVFWSNPWPFPFCWKEVSSFFGKKHIQFLNGAARATPDHLSTGAADWGRGTALAAATTTQNTVAGGRADCRWRLEHPWRPSTLVLPLGTVCCHCREMGDNTQQTTDGALMSLATQYWYCPLGPWISILEICSLQTYSLYRTVYSTSALFVWTLSIYRTVCCIRHCIRTLSDCTAYSTSTVWYVGMQYACHLTRVLSSLYSTAVLSLYRTAYSTSTVW